MAEDTRLSVDPLNTNYSARRVAEKLNEICDELNETSGRLESQERLLQQLFDLLNEEAFCDGSGEAGLGQSQLERVLTNVVESLYACSRIKEYNGREDVGYAERDFEGSAQMAVVGLRCFGALLSRLRLDQDEKIQRRVIFYALLLSAEHAQSTLWTSPTSQSAAEELIRTVTRVSGSSVEALLCGLEDRVCLFKDFLSFLQPRFTSTNWKQSPSLKHVFQWFLFKVRFPELSKYINQVLPATLMLLDDHEVNNQVMGIRCLDHILDNVSKTELSWYGRADVLYDSLQRLTYSHEPQLIVILHPCLLKVLAAKEMKSKSSQTVRTISAYDDVFQRLLYSMELETRLDARRAQSQHLSLYIETLHINTVKHFTQLFRVVFSFLEVYDGPHEVTRMNVLIALKAILLNCWPRIPNRCEQILKSLIKFLYEIITDRTVTPDDVKEELIMQTVECLVLLKRLCPQGTVSALNIVKEVGLGPKCTMYIDKVLTTE